MAPLSAYSQVLRVIGQVVDEHQLGDFALEIHDHEFVVRGRKKGPPERRSLFKAILAVLRRRPSTAPELRYTLEELERLDLQGRLKRRDPHRAPDFYSLPQTLRTLGAYFDRKAARLLAVNRQGSRIIVDYEGFHRRRTTEEHSVASLYGWFVTMYLQRGERR